MLLRSLLATCLLWFLNLTTALAQCPMCKATVESSINSGDTTAAGLNDGIFLLLGMPFLAVAVVAGLWYRKYRQAQLAGH